MQILACTCYQVPNEAKKSSPGGNFFTPPFRVPLFGALVAMRLLFCETPCLLAPKLLGALVGTWVEKFVAMEEELDMEPPKVLMDDVTLETSLLLLLLL